MSYQKQILCLLILLMASHSFAKNIQVSHTSAVNLEQSLSLEQAVQWALTNEAGIQSQQWQTKSLKQRAIADGQLKDPKLQLGLNNLPSDSFNFDQENMTQFKVGIIQQFPAGNSLKLKQQKTLTQSQLIGSKIAARKSDIIKKVRLAYLELYYWQQAKRTIIQNKKYFKQLLGIVQSLFSVGRNNQYNLIRAQLELSRLNDRLTKINQQINNQRSILSRWIGHKNSQQALADKLPDLAFSLAPKSLDFESLSGYFISHPKIKQIDNQLEISHKEIQLIKESYKPGWALNISYGYRDANPNGQYRSDFISAGVTLDLPVFTANRQDKKLLAKEYNYQALKNQRIELLHQLVAELEQQINNNRLAKQRHQHYRETILPQTKQQEQAALLAYQSDKGRFSDVIRAYIDNLNALLAEQKIAVEYLQTNAKILYLVGE